MSKGIAKRWAMPVIVGLAAAAVIGLWLRSQRLPPEPISSSGGVALDIPSPTGTAYFLQRDARWAKDSIGGSGEPMSAVGCTVCAVAMAASQLGYDVTPKELNANLVQSGGYTRRGWLVWSAVSNATHGKVHVRVPSGLTHAEIDQSLQSGSIPVVKFYLPGHIPHWVPIVGKAGTEYLVKDPLDEKKQIRALSEKTTAVVSVRYVEKR
jgi:hypothetical protein